MLVALWLAAPILPAQSPSQPDPGPSAEDLSAGERVFESQCSRCHGVGGTGGTGPAFTQPKLRRAATDSDLVAVIQNGVPGTAMAGFWNLQEDEARQVAAYVRALGKRPAEVLPGDIAAGRLLYEGRGQCGTCHILQGEGAGWAPDLSEAGLRMGSVYVRQALLDPGAAQPISPLPSVHGPYPAFLAVEATTRAGRVVVGTRVTEDDFTLVVRDPAGRLHSLDKASLRRLVKREGKSPMPSYAGVLSEGEIDDLVAFIMSQRGTP